jgi:hypothetical protein
MQEFLEQEGELRLYWLGRKRRKATEDEAQTVLKRIRGG